MPMPSFAPAARRLPAEESSPRIASGRTAPPLSLQDYLIRILNARVYDVAVETPLDAMPCLSDRLARRVYLKREDMQPVFSFKLRGAYNKMVRLPAALRARGVIAASAGNHAQGVAMSAQYLDCPATLVMPATTPRIKREAVARRGAQIVLHGDSYSDAYEHAMTLVAQSGLIYIPPFDDPDVIAGQGTVAMEILRQHADPVEAVFVQIGGGGLAAGVGCYIKQLRPEVKVIGVQAVDSDAMRRSIACGERLTLAQVGLFSDGTAVKQVGEETLRLCREVLHEIICVDNDAICAAIKDVFEDTRAVLEPAGALSLAGAKLWAMQQADAGRPVGAAASGTPSAGALIAIASGANLNFDRLRHVSERAELGEAREAVLAVTIPEQPGSFLRFCQLLGQRSITEFNYRYGHAAQAHIFVGLQINAPQETQDLVAQLNQQGLPALDLSRDEMAKLHIRHLVGGHAPQVHDECVYRVEFPERPGALLHFLTQLGRHRWNISLFHYRNHGADFGRVLIGLQVPTSEKDRLTRCLHETGYHCHEENGNPAYRLFLG